MIILLYSRCCNLLILYVVWHSVVCVVKYAVWVVKYAVWVVKYVHDGGVRVGVWCVVCGVWCVQLAKEVGDQVEEILA